MPLISGRENSSRFWNRSTVLFAACGLFAYLASLWLFETRSGWVLVAVSTGRLMLGVGPAALIARRMGWRPAGPLYPVTFAAPYPTELALFAYGNRFQVLPRDLIISLTGPTTFLSFLISVLLVSRWTTTWALPAGVRDREAERLRLLGGVLFVLTAAGAILAPLGWEVLFLRSVPEPIASIGYCAIVGHAERRGTRE